MTKTSLSAIITCIGLIQSFSVRAGIVDLGIIAIGTNVNASILNSSVPSQSQTYTYQQLVFQGPNLGLTLDGGLTVADVLTSNFGSSNGGTLTYNFPFTFGASGAYVQNGLPMIGVSPGQPLDFTATSVSGHVYAGFNNAGATIALDPTNAAVTYSAILAGTGTGLVNGIPVSTTTTVTITLGSIGNTSYQGEDVTTTWQTAGGVSGAGPTAVPEPHSPWMSLLGLAAIVIVRNVKMARASGCASGTRECILRKDDSPLR